MFAQEMISTHQTRNEHNGLRHHFEINRTTEQYTLMKSNNSSEAVAGPSIRF